VNCPKISSVFVRNEGQRVLNRVDIALGSAQISRNNIPTLMSCTVGMFHLLFLITHLAGGGSCFSYHLFIFTYTLGILLFKNTSKEVLECVEVLI